MTDVPDTLAPLPESAWRELRQRAREAMSRAYAPYSGFPVGAAALVDDGRTVSGCNVENAAYGVALCAECGLVSALFASGGGRLTAFTCCDREGRVLMPCGRCRQLLWEHGGPRLRVDTARGIRPLAELLPDAFGAADLERAASPAPGADPAPGAGPESGADPERDADLER
ncbi:cytidine deaminase [Streptomyces youssoufiensis]